MEVIHVRLVQNDTVLERRVSPDDELHVRAKECCHHGPDTQQERVHDVHHDFCGQGLPLNDHSEKDDGMGQVKHTRSVRIQPLESVLSHLGSEGFVERPEQEPHTIRATQQNEKQGQ